MVTSVFPLKETWGRKFGERPAGDPAEVVGSERGWQHFPEGLLAAITMMAWLPRAGKSGSNGLRQGPSASWCLCSTGPMLLAAVMSFLS